jgi:hypothetical protein
MINVKFVSQDGTKTRILGPFSFIRQIYSIMFTGDDAMPIAAYRHGLWYLEDGTRWADFIVSSVK